MKKVLLSVLLLTFCGYQLRAQGQVQTDTASVQIYFKQGYSTLEPSFRGNGANLDAFIEQLKQIQQNPSYKIGNIRIVSGASPEGNTDANKRLSQQRAANIRSFFDERIEFPNSTFRVDALGVDWEGLTRLVEASDMPYRTQALDILRNTPEWITRNGVVVDGRKRQLSLLAGGKVWRYMYDNLFPELRSSGVEIFCEIERVALPEPEPVVEPQPEPEVEEVDQVEVVEVTPVPAVTEPEKPAEPQTPATASEKKPFYMALKTNLLYDAALVPNIGAEFYLGNGWSLGGNWMYAWWKTDRHHDYWRTYGGELELRKYFGKAAAAKPMTGHHLGLYGQMLTYDFELGGTGNLSKVSYGAGIEYGYSLPIGRRLNLDFGIGLGYLGGEYKKYTPQDGHYVWQATYQRHWFGPTKAEISLVWLLGRGNYNANKQSK